MNSLRRLTMALALCCALATLGATTAAAGERADGSASGTPAQTAGKGGGKKNKKVHKAWPHKKSGKKPHLFLARKLARQIGPIKIKKRKGKGKASAQAALASGARPRASTTGSPGVVDVKSGDGRLLLVRSFDIPRSDPQYADLSNYSWTYDNALATIAFVGDKDRSQARQLLDQLAVLQNKNGSIDFAFDVATGGSAPLVRSGAVAWLGLAAAAYADKYGEGTYDAMIGGVVDYLLASRNAKGLVPGGPDVSWVSTQHNLLTVELLRQLPDLLKGNEKFGSYDADQLTAAHRALVQAINSNLIVAEGSSVHFRQGLDDSRIPMDVQALGAMYLETNGDKKAADAVGDYILQPGFFIPSRSTAAAPTKVSGLRPFLEPQSPDLIWSEGTIEAQFALERIGSKSKTLDEAVDSLAATGKSNTVGPIGADRDSTTSWGEYRTWAASAATSWLLLVDLEDKVPLFKG